MTMTMIESWATRLNEASLPDDTTEDKSVGDLEVQVTAPVLVSYHIEEADRPCDEVDGVPVAILDLYAEIAVRHALVEEIEDGEWFASVVGLQGAYGEGTSAEEALADLRHAIVGWVALKRRSGATDIPQMEGMDLNPSEGPSGDTSQGHEAA